jgi:hypothetical protein
MKSNNNNNNDDDDDDDDDDNNNNNTAMGSVHARGDTFLTFGLKALTETNTSRLATGCLRLRRNIRYFVVSRAEALTLLIYIFMYSVFEKNYETVVLLTPQQ